MRSNRFQVLQNFICRPQKFPSSCLRVSRKDFQSFNMNIPSLRPIFVLPFLLLAFAASLSAQEEGQQSEAPKAKPKRVFTCLYWEGLPQETLYYRMGEEFLPIEFNNSRRSMEYALKNMASFELYRDAEKPTEDKPPYDLLSKTSIPSGTNRVLFLVIPFDQDDSTTYKVVAMDDSLSAFPRGTFRFANFTNQTLLVKFAGDVEKIPASQMSVMSCKAGKAGGFRTFIIGTAQGKQIFGTKLFGQPSGRELVFISPPLRRDSNTPRVKFISQLIGAQPPAAQQ